MSLEDWLTDKLIETHRPSAREIANLLHICDRDPDKIHSDMERGFIRAEVIGPNDR